MGIRDTIKYFKKTIEVSAVPLAVYAFVHLFGISGVSGLEREVGSIKPNKKIIQVYEYSPVLNSPKPTDCLHENPLYRNNVIVIDAGHGGKDPGACSGNIREKNVNLIMAVYLRDKLVENGYTSVLLTRTNDKYISLEDRVKYGKEHNANIFLSLHCNSAGGEAGKTANGFEIWAKGNKDLILGKALEQSYITATSGKTRSRGVKKGNYVVLGEKGKDSASVIVEPFFLSNQKEYERFNIVKLAEGIVKGIEEYYSH